MRRKVCLLLLISSLASAGGCKETATNQQPPTAKQASASPAPGRTNVNATASPAAQAAAVKGDVDPCSLLSSAEIQAVQGEPLEETKPGGQAAGGLLNLQCLYQLPTFSDSVSLAVTEKDPSAAGGRTAQQYWQVTFRERETEEQSAKPQAVRGLGDEAFWTVSRVGGALYVLKGERFIMISVGGKGDAEAKLKKAKVLAQDALRRL